MRRPVRRFRHLPFAPRPVAGELVSSWLLRVAAQNCITLRELLAAVKLSYPNASVELASLDYQLPCEFRAALARFCRVPTQVVGELELHRQFPGVPRQMFLAFPFRLDLITRAAEMRARYDFCLNCVNESSADNTPAVIRAVWSLAPITHCHLHNRPLIPDCPRCQAEDPLLFPTLPGDPHVRCRQCGCDLSTSVQPFDHAPLMKFVTAVERAYLSAIAGMPPESLGLEEASGPAFRELVECFVVLFSTRLTWQSSHIPAIRFLDWDVALRYFYSRGVAEGQLEFFSWKWRYAVMYCVATAILGLPERPGAPPRSEHTEAFPFRDFLHVLSRKRQLEMIQTSRRWPEPLQVRLWLAIKLLEGRTWHSRNSLRFKCQ